MDKQRVQSILKKIIPSLRQESTWQGIVKVLIAFGLAISPDQAVASIAAGSAIAGAIGLFTDNEQ